MSALVFKARKCVDRYFPDDVVDEVLAWNDGVCALSRAVEGAAERLCCGAEEAFMQLSIELTDEDRYYIRGKCNAIPDDVGSYLAEQIEQGRYLVCLGNCCGAGTDVPDDAD